MKKDSEFAVFNYEFESQGVIDELIQYLNQRAKEIIDFFNIKYPIRKTIINIIPTKREFDLLFKEECGFDATKSSRGICKRDGSINFLSINDYKNTTHTFEKENYIEAIDGFKKTLVHEFVHYVNKIFNYEYGCEFTATYLFEGIAVYLSKQKENKIIAFDYSIVDFFKKEVGKRKYDAYYAVTKYLIENYDKHLVMELLKDKNSAEKFLKEELYLKVKDFYSKLKR